MHAAAIRVGEVTLVIAGPAFMSAGIRAGALLGHLSTTDVRLHAGQTVVDRGPAAGAPFLLHGMLMTLLGTGLALSGWAAPASFVQPGALVVCIRVEEQVGR